MFGVVRRWIAKRRLGRSVDVWFHPAYAPAALGESARVSTIDVERGARVLSALERDGLLALERVRRPQPATVGELARFHPLAYLESTNDPATVARVFGLEPSHVDVRELVKASVSATGGTLAAARDVVATASKWAFNLGGGFHHARADLGAGFCVHNDIAVAIANLRAEGFKGRVLIIDLDFHQGDGFVETYADDPTVRVYSIHGSIWSHIDAPLHYQHHLAGRVGDRRYLRCLRWTLPGALVRHRPSLVFYLAGNDVLTGDALGTFDLTLQGVLDRDRFVLDAVRLRGTPLVCTLGGGYSRHAWRATYAMLRYALSGEARVSPAHHQSLRGRFSEVAARLDPLELQADEDELKITEADLSGSLFGTPSADRLLDYYSPHGVEVALARYGMLEALASRGFDGIKTELELNDRSRQVVRVRARRRGSRERHLLIELVVRRAWIPDPADSTRRIEMLSIEWLLMQDPTRHFSLARPPLPGQSHPGLGVAVPLQEALIQAAIRIGLHGLIHRPAHFHTAWGAGPSAVFVDPVEEGHMQALTEALSAPLDEISHAVEDGRVLWGDGAPFQWAAGVQALPLSDSLKAWFDGSTYRRAVEDAKAAALRRGLHMALTKEEVPAT